MTWQHELVHWTNAEMQNFDAAGDYPRGDDCGGNGQLVCNDNPHCDEGLFASYPEGICLPSIATAANCGTLGNLPCDNGRLCETGLAVRYAPRRIMLQERAVMQESG